VTSDEHVRSVSRRVRDLIEPLAANVYFAPEALEAYKELGLSYLPGYFRSRSACMGDVSGEVVVATFGVFNNRFKFTGREYQAAFGIYEYRNRAYHPGLGRFLSEDPMGFAAGDSNMFRYCGGDPVNRRDPFGLEDQNNSTKPPPQKRKDGNDWGNRNWEMGTTPSAGPSTQGFWSTPEGFPTNLTSIASPGTSGSGPGDMGQGGGAPGGGGLSYGWQTPVEAVTERVLVTGAPVLFGAMNAGADNFGFMLGEVTTNYHSNSSFGYGFSLGGHVALAQPFFNPGKTNTADVGIGVFMGPNPNDSVMSIGVYASEAGQWAGTSGFFGSAGGGPALWFTNAPNAEAFAQMTDAYMLNLGMISLNLNTGGGYWQGAISSGRVGFTYSHYTSTTVGYTLRPPGGG